VIANWKMHGTLAEAIPLASRVLDGMRRVAGVEVVLCPPFTALGRVGELLRGSSLALGAQDCHWATRGAFTGEVSPGMLAELGCRYVLVGHSERRQLFGETDEHCRLKVEAALAHGLIPVLCVGERLEQRERGDARSVVEGQLEKGLRGVEGPVVIAYEPVWAIGTGVNATPAQAAEVHAAIRRWISEAWSKERAAQTRLLYGGSIKPENFAPLIGEDEIDGGLVGGASLDAASFLRLVEVAAQTLS
jgi:triosephosphate isomerase